MRKKIVAAAVKRDGVIVTGRRHCDCIRDAIRKHDWDIPVREEEQGFVDEDGDFYRRSAAAQIAMANGQLPKDFNKVLTSECLW
jgi:hypothetical protein